VITGVKFKDGIEVTTGNQVAAGSISKHQIWRELKKHCGIRDLFSEGQGCTPYQPIPLGGGAEWL